MLPAWLLASDDWELAWACSPSLQETPRWLEEFGQLQIVPIGKRSDTVHSWYTARRWWAWGREQGRED